VALIQSVQGFRMRRTRKTVITVISIIAALTVTVNAASASCILNLFSQLPISSAIENQNILKVYSQIAVIPINIMNRLMGAKAPARSMAGKADTSEKSSGAKTQNTSDMSFAPSQLNESITRVQTGSWSGIGGIGSDIYGMPPGYCLKFTPTGQGIYILFMFMLLFLITLRRSSLPAPNMQLIYFKKTQSSRLKQDWVFYFLGGF